MPLDKSLVADYFILGVQGDRDSIIGRPHVHAGTTRRRARHDISL
jgi:hypothetical protein